MDKRYFRTIRPNPRNLVDEPDTFCFQLNERALDIIYSQADVMNARAPLF